MWKRAVIWGAAVLVIAIALILIIRKRLQKSGAVIQGAVLMQDADPRRQLPIPGVDVTAEVGDLTVQNKSDASGLFRLTVPRALWRTESADLRFRHPSYQPVYITQPLTDQIYVIRMVAVAAKAVPQSSAPQATIKDVRVRYATTATTPINVGSIAKTFAQAVDWACSASSSSASASRPCRRRSSASFATARTDFDGNDA